MPPGVSLRCVRCGALLTTPPEDRRHRVDVLCLRCFAESVARANESRTPPEDVIEDP